MIESTLSGMDRSGGIAAWRPVFEIRQRHDPDGALRVTLLGELDLAVADRLRARLDQLRQSEPRVRLDLSQLDFIDCCGLGGILGVLEEARRHRWRLEVDRFVSPSVGRIASLGDFASALWPPEAAAVRATAG